MRKTLLSILSLLVFSTAFGQISFQGQKFSPSAGPTHKPAISGLDLGWGSSVGLSFITGVRMGNFRDSAATGYGALVDAELMLNEKIGAGLQTGFLYFKTDPVNLGDGKHTFIPICLRGAYYFDYQPFKLYAGLVVGYYIGKKDYTFVSPPYFDPVLNQTVPGRPMSMSGNLNAFGFGPMIGAMYKIDEEFSANFGFQYDMLLTEKKSTSFTGIKFGVVYKLAL